MYKNIYFIQKAIMGEINDLPVYTIVTHTLGDLVLESKAKNLQELSKCMFGPLYKVLFCQKKHQWKPKESFNYRNL